MSATLSSFAHIELFQIEVHLPGFYLAEIQHVVDQSEQVTAGRLNLVQIRREVGDSQFNRFLLEHFTVADDRVQGCPQFVAHGGEKSLLAWFAAFAASFTASLAASATS